MSTTPPGDPDLMVEHWNYRLVRTDDEGSVVLIEVYYEDESEDRIFGWSAPSVSGESEAELMYALSEMVGACHRAMIGKERVLDLADLPETDPTAWFDQDSDYTNN